MSAIDLQPPLVRPLYSQNESHLELEDFTPNQFSFIYLHNFPFPFVCSFSIHSPSSQAI